MPQKHVRELAAAILAKVPDSEDLGCFIYTNPTSPQAAIEYCTSPAREDKIVPRELLTVRVFDVGSQRLWVTFHPKTHAYSPQKFLINPGVGISTHQAEHLLKDIDTLREVKTEGDSLRPSANGEQELYEKLRQRVVEIINTAPRSTSGPRPTSSDVYLFSTGMAAIYRVHLYLLHTFNKPTVQYGFPFHSTKHIFEDFSEPGHLFLGNADEADLATLKSHLAELKAKGEGIQALWTEFPGNPSCHTPDLTALRKLADQYGFILIVDDTVAGTANVDVLPEADIVITSLTKSFSGYADVMGGSAVLNPAAKRYDELKQIFEKHYRNELYHIDAGILLHNSANYYERSAVHNRNTDAIVQFFESRLKKQNSAISKIFHPTTLPSAELYRKYMRPKTETFTPGYGLLLSVEFVNIEAIAAFHDAAQLYKSPHLGAHVTLILPYVKGIYHKELDVVGQWGMRETQMRIAPGLEDTEELLGKFAVAMDAAEGVVAANGTK